MCLLFPPRVSVDGLSSPMLQCTPNTLRARLLGPLKLLSLNLPPRGSVQPPIQLDFVTDFAVIHTFLCSCAVPATQSMKLNMDA